MKKYQKNANTNFREKGNKSSTIRINGWVGILVITILLASCTLIIGASSYFYGVKIGYKSLLTRVLLT